MSNEADIVVEDVSVALIAAAHNPSLINPDFLRNNNIAPKVDCGVRTTMTTTFRSHVEFGSADASIVGIIVEPGKCVIQEPVNGDFKEEYYIYDMAGRYASVLQHIPYLAMGLNWNLNYKIEDDFPAWLKKRFLKNEWHDGMQATNFGFKVDADRKDVVCNFSLQEAPSQNTSKSSVAIGCNFHFDLHLHKQGGKVERIKEVLGNWQKYQTLLKKEYISKYFISGGKEIDK